MRFLIACGGTGGHIYPGLAIADYIKTRHPDAEIMFVGKVDGMESRLVPQAGYKFYPVQVSGFQRSFDLQSIKINIRTIKRLILIRGKVKKLLNEYKPDMVIGTGGYASGPVVLGAAKRGIKTAIHEQNAFPGVTTKLLSKRVDVVMLAVGEAKKYLSDGVKTVTTGNPVREGVIFADREKSRAELGLDERPVVLSFAGSLGSDTINNVMAELVKEECKRGDVQHIHATGKGAYEKMLRMLSEQGVDLSKNPQIRIREYIDDMDRCMAAADIIVSRSGAITLSEIQVCGKASILIPSPYVAENHQYHNAKVLSDNGAAVLIEEKDLTSQKLIDELFDLVSQPQKLAQLKKNAAMLSLPDANEKIYNVIMEIYNG